MSLTDPGVPHGPLAAQNGQPVPVHAQPVLGPQVPAYGVPQPYVPEPTTSQPSTATVAGNVTITNTQAPTYFPVAVKKKAWTVFWLDMFFGFLGVHRFYLGHIGLGFLYLFTGGLFGIGAIVDLFIAWKITRKENVRRGWGPVTK